MVLRSARLDLHMHWRTGLAVALTVAVAVAAVLPVTAFFDVAGGRVASRLAVLPAGGGLLGLTWNAPVQTAAVTQQDAVRSLAVLLLLLALATLVIAVVTVFAMAIGQEATRAGERGIHRAVGASRQMLASSSLLEALALAGGGCLVGGLAGVGLARIAAARWPGTVGNVVIPFSVIAVAALVAMVVLGHLFPFALPRRSVPEAVSGATVPVFPSVLQVATCLVALTMSALIARQADGMLAAGSGDVAGRQVLRISLAGVGPAERAVRYASLLQGLEAGAAAGPVSLTSPGALVGLGPVSLVTTDCGTCVEAGMPIPWRIKPATYQIVSADTFSMLGVPVVEGRGITRFDGWTAPRVAVVSRSLARREFQDGEAVGRRLRTGDAEADWSTVVGVVEDPEPFGLGGALQPRYAVYLSVLQHPPDAAELLIGSAPSPAVNTAVTSALGPRSGRRWSEESSLKSAEAAPLAWFGRLFRMEGWGMLVVSTLGAFLLMDMWVRSLLVELGVRKSVGARRRHLVWFVVGRAMGVGVAGVIAGMWFGSAAWGLLPTILTGAAVWDAAILLRFGGLLLLCVTAGALIPAWRAARQPPSRLLVSGSTGR